MNKLLDPCEIANNTRAQVMHWAGTFPQMTENHVFESLPSADYLDGDLGYSLQLLETHSRESREEAGCLKNELASVTGQVDFKKIMATGPKPSGL